ncbi:MAG: DNA internalization-related competence protein ComEC/Rec2 [Deltaproteobacteria bacterium]|nr:DNA internalization-related competence protein ComEC/Rec2 [Deltaproteobacteria bacterium]
MLIPFLALAAGLTIADLSGVLLPFSAVAAAMGCLLLSCLLPGRVPLAACTFVFFLVWGLFALTPWKAPSSSPYAIERHAAPAAVTVEGVVSSRPVATPNGGSFIMRTETVISEGRQLPASGSLLVYVSAGDIPVARGDRVRLAARITMPRRLGLPGEFDYPRYLSLRGIAATARLETADEIVLMRGAAEDSPLRRLDLAARRLGDFIRAALPDTEVSSVLAALLLGDQKRIPEQLASAYTRAGVNHILSISGFHVGIIAFFIVQISLLLAVRCERLAIGFNLRRLVLLLSLPAMLLYLFLTGAAPATARSVIMLAGFVLALYAERETDPVNALLFSALLLLALNPPSLFDISFQLSFLALWGIVIAVPAVMERLSPIRHGWPRALLQFVVTSCAASFATMVPVLFIFDQASINGIISNFLIVPLLGYGAVLAGFCALPFVFIFAPAATGLLWLAGKLTAMSNRLIMLFAEMPLLRFHGITPWDMAAFLAFMSVLTFVKGRALKATLCLLLPSAAVLAHLVTGAPADGRLHVIMLSVGQGESMLIRMPEGDTMLVDGGGYLRDNGRDFGERILAPALFRLGVRRIDRMVMTHSHSDHSGGLAYVALTLPVGEFLEAAPGGDGEDYERLRANLVAKRVPMRHLSSGEVIRLSGSVAMTVLSPPRTAQHHTVETFDGKEMNEDSLVFRLSHGANSVLFTADSGFPAEERILASKAAVASSVLKVGHHGSRFSTSAPFLDRVAPQIALISAGYGNSFGLPSKRTLGLLEKRGIRTYRTDRDGSIELVSDGSGWEIFTPWRP